MTRILVTLLALTAQGVFLSGCPATLDPDDDDAAAGDDDDIQGDDDAAVADDDDSMGDDDDTHDPGSAGCGQAAAHGSGGVTVTVDAGPEGDGERTFWLSLPAQYDPETPHALILGYPGTDWIGEWVQPYLDLEGGAPSDEIFVYPDPLWREFEGWGTYGGWVLGPYAHPADGEQDLVFTEELLDYMEATYCIDTDRVFATGHSWGGDMAQVVSCFLGDRVRASVPVAGNRPYWFERNDGSAISCVGDTAVWTLFGIGDDHFTWQDFPGQFGDEQRDFWIEERSCDGSHSYDDLGYGDLWECVEFTGCSSITRYCLYGPQTGHQVPNYYSDATMTFFRSF